MATKPSPFPQPIPARPPGCLRPGESMARVDPLSPHVCSPSAPGLGRATTVTDHRGPPQSTAPARVGEGQHAGAQSDRNT